MRKANLHKSIPLISTLYLVIVYLLGVFSESAWSDDYAAFNDPSSVALHAEKDGRVLYGILIDWFFSNIEEVGHLKYIRLIGLSGILLINYLVIVQLLKYSKSKTIPLASSIAFTLPSFQLSAHWAIAFCISWSAFLSVLGFYTYRNASKFHKILGVTLCMLSLLLYPLMTFFVFSVLFAEVLIKGWSFESSMKSLKEGLFFVTMGSFVSAVAALINLSWRGLEPNDRVELVALEELPEKLQWFATRPLALSFRPFDISSPGILEMMLTFLIVFCLISLMSTKVYGNLESTFKFLLTLLCFTTLSLLPLLIASQNQIDIRFIGSSSWIVLFSIIFLFVRTSKILLEKNQQKIISIFLVFILCLYGFASINYRFATVIKPIYSNSNLFILNELKLCSDNQIANGILVVKRTKPWPSRQLLGFFSQTTDLASEWVPIGSVKLVLIKNSKDFNEIEFTSSEYRNKSFCYVQLDKF